MTDPASRSTLPISFPVLLLAGMAFAAAYGQAPLFYSNQNQYFVHGYAHAGQDLLDEDWLAGTLDPTPVFTALVSFTVEFLSPWVFHVYEFLLLALYGATLLILFASFVEREVFLRRWPLFLFLLILLHSAAIRWLSYRLFGQDYPWYFQSGVAGQYVLGSMFQPSVFGVWLLVAVTAFVRGHPMWAAFLVSLAGTVHPTYLLPGALLTLGFLISYFVEKRRGAAIRLGLVTLILVVPITLYSVWTFDATSAKEFREAQNILVNVRIPHHSRPDLWLDWIAVLQILWMGVGIVLSFRTRFFLVLLIPFLLGTVLTLVQVATNDPGLALLFPWRISSVLMPLATGVILSRGVSRLATRSASEELFKTSSLALRAAAVYVGIICLAAIGIWISLGRLAFHISEDELPLLNFVESNRERGDVYLLPVRVPDLVSSTRGSLSSDFKPLPDKRQDARIIPIDLQRFRLQTGTPIFVDFKSVPYKDVEVIEWRNRLRLAEQIQEKLLRKQAHEVIPLLQKRGINHVIFPATVEWSDPRFERIYRDEAYQIFKLLRQEW